MSARVPDRPNAPRPLLEGQAALGELALDLRSSWNHATDPLWRQLDPVLWENTHNPWVVLQTVSRDRIAALLADPAFRATVDGHHGAHRQAETAPAWFQREHPGSPLTSIAYFSLEFMLSEALPIYSGGLGNVAGDQLKAASDLGVPVTGVGLLYQQGYFRQVLGRDGAQQALYPYNDPGQLPITPLRQPNGEWLRIEVALPGYSIWLRAWQVQVGRLKLFLLDSNDPANHPPHRGITSQLYGGGDELRLKQELLLGFGGMRLLEALGRTPQVCHLNEGHAAFAVLERAHQFMRTSGLPFAAALAVTRAGNLFTTHTAVDAGFDRFDPALIAQYLGPYAEHKLGLSLHQLLALGRADPDHGAEPFNMAYLAVRGSGAVNGVSRLHGQVSRHLFEPLFPHWPADEVPIGHITNGVHMPTWDSAPADALWTEACGKDRWLGMHKNLAEAIRRLPDARLWHFRTEASQAFVAYVRDRLPRQLALAGATSAAVAEAGQVLDPHALTLGLARRFATYKRPNLLLRDPERLLRLLSDPARPVQLVLAGKAHPEDRAGQALIQAWMTFIRQAKVQAKVVFLADYDMFLTGQMVQGVDVWLNTPRRPWEACGTSGMKVLVNGGLNLSERDGWWAEACAPEVGWALGDGLEHADAEVQDGLEADALYTLLEREVVPEFYARDDAGLPIRWLERMRESMARLTPSFSADRTVREYTEQHYLPAAQAYLLRSAGAGAGGAKLEAWRLMLDENWETMRFREWRFETVEGRHVFFAHLHLNGVDPSAVRVELYAEGAQDQPPVHQEMLRTRDVERNEGGYLFTGSVPADREATQFTPRVVPIFPGAAIPLENSRILWAR